MNSISFVTGEKPLQREGYLKRADIENVTEIAKEIHCHSSAPLKLRLVQVYFLCYEMRGGTVPKHFE